MLWIVCALAAAAPLALARQLAHLKQPPITFSNVQKNGLTAAASPQAYYFDQLLDHSNPSLGTFQQRYYFFDGYYKEGGPIVLFNAGEEDASLYTGYLQNITISGAIAYATGGATIVMEHRYWGASIPFANYSTANMKYHTLENSIQDFAHFALNVELPFTSGTKALPPPTTPWITIGGSYPGALSAYVKHTFPDLFWASYATSAPVQAISDFYGYFLPVVAGGPQNCTNDMKAVITHWDSVMSTGTEEDQRALMTVFGLQNVTHTVDAASALQEAPWSWQSMGPAGAGQDFFEFCDVLEVKDGVSAGPEGYGLDYALAQWGAWQTQYSLDACGSSFIGDACWGSFDADASFYTDVSPTNTYRPWMWIICNDLGFWQDGDPTGPSIVSKQVNVAYWERQCPLWFPPEDGVAVPASSPVDRVNSLYGGWDITEERLILVNGEFDPWRSGSVASLLPEAPKRESTSTQPLLLVKTGVHCWDMITATAQANPNTRVVFDAVVAQMVAWMKEWDDLKA
ncbi:peptidase S28 [Roridomyces roridus]|uniref:Peptidase S28 n=1 Tax=Roridomyces roridus TaxID=1738132 RepID=A0AAD7G1H2_9AGAR|nr:peptidase S28 [Roridomyces roridus]